MKKWKCLVCGYIHEGDEPPEKCPVCKADANQFEEVTEEDLLEETPAEEAAPKETTAEEAAPEEAPEEEAPEEEAPEEEAPAEETAAEAVEMEASAQEEAAKEEEEAEQTATEETPAEEAPVKKWRCTVCNYIHEGPEPPEICPVCGADKSKFVEFKDGDVIPSRKKPAPKKEDKPEAAATETNKVEEAPAEAALPEPEPVGFIEKYDHWLSLMTKYHAHPIAVHMPNGVVPLSFIFMCLSIMFGSQSLGQAYFYNMIAVLIAMPWVLFTGYVDWQRVYNGASTTVFNSKIVCGLIVASMAFILVVWRVFQPDILMAGASGRWFFVLLNLIMVGAAGYAGYQGGKLVFNK